MLEVAKDFPEYTFAIADEEDYSDELKSLGLSESGEEVNVGILGEGGKKYAMEPEEFDSDVLRSFVMAFKKGKVLVCYVCYALHMEVHDFISLKKSWSFKISDYILFLL